MLILTLILLWGSLEPSGILSLLPGWLIGRYVQYVGFGDLTRPCKLSANSPRPTRAPGTRALDVEQDKAPLLSP